LEDLAKITDIKRQSPDFANAREVRNIIQQVIMNASVRTVDDSDNRSIIADDVLQYAKDSGYDLSNGGSGEMSPELKKGLYDGIYALPGLYKEIANEKFSVNQKFLEQAVVSVSDEEGQGTGFIISPDGFVLTCAHCISKKEQKIRVAFFTEDGQRIFKYFPFVTILGDKVNDVALLRIATDDYKFKFFSLASKKSADYTPTHDFYMAGYPFGGESFQEISVTTGKVASVNVINDGTRTAVFADMFGKPGNSGSPTIDAETSKVIGIFWGGIGPGSDIIPCFTPIQPIWELLKQALVILKTSDGDYFGE
jgi:S1-C subfamily serine protease